MKLQLQAKKCVPKYHLNHIYCHMRELFQNYSEYDMLLPELDEVLPVTAHHTWVFHGPCTGMSIREG